MSNRYAEFEGNIPPKKLSIWWHPGDPQIDGGEGHWEFWFGDEGPMYADGEYTPFRAPLFEYKASVANRRAMIKKLERRKTRKGKTP
jgi:hypothetical protein